MGKLINLTGQKYGRLLVVQRDARYTSAGVRWVCECACGTTISVLSQNLRNGNTKSCGCLMRELAAARVTTHGMSNSKSTGYANRAYGAWQAMRDRCNNKNRSDYKYYGGRGIAVCRRWNKFENFYADMGDPPDGLTLDRKNNNKGYCKSNCTWRTRKEQVYNSSSVRIVTLDCKAKPLREWLRVYGTNRGTFYQRLRRGWSVSIAIKTKAK